MFTLFGPQLVRDLQALSFDVFLDLKFHDILNTTAQAVAVAAADDLGVWMVNIHASGGASMIAAAKEALLPYGANARILVAVTVLTSMEQDDLHGIGIDVRLAEYVERLAHSCRLDGVVCSAHEAQRLKAACGRAFQLVKPGIRPAGSAAGVDYMVIGRPIMQSVDPAATLRAIRASLA